MNTSHALSECQQPTFPDKHGATLCDERFWGFGSNSQHTTKDEQEKPNARVPVGSLQTMVHILIFTRTRVQTTVDQDGWLLRRLALGTDAIAGPFIFSYWPYSLSNSCTAPDVYLCDRKRRSHVEKGGREHTLPPSPPHYRTKKVN